MLIISERHIFFNNLYNDPKSKDYLNKGKLRAAANAYRDRKLGQGRPYDRMDATSKGRFKLVENVISTLDEFEAREETFKRQIEDKLYSGINKPIGEQFLQKSDVENVIDNENVAEQAEPVPEAVNELVCGNK